MLHKISGHNFHGRYRLRLRGPAEGFVLSDAQARRYWRALCPFADCTCGGGYGEGPDRDSATVVWTEMLCKHECRALGIPERLSYEDALYLCPAKREA